MSNLYYPTDQRGKLEKGEVLIIHRLWIKGIPSMCSFKEVDSGYNKEQTKYQIIYGISIFPQIGLNE